MENNEVLSTQEVTPTIEEVQVTPTTTEAQEPIIEEVQTTPTTEVQEPIISEEELNTLMQEILNTPKEEEEPKEEEQSEDTITDQDLEELDNIITDLEKQVTEKDTKISELSEEITTIKTDLEKYTNDYKSLEDWLNKISEHPVLWPLAIKLVKWEEVNIPDYLIKAVESDLEALPNMDWLTTQSNPEKEISSKNRVLSALNRTYK